MTRGGGGGRWDSDSMAGWPSLRGKLSPGLRTDLGGGGQSVALGLGVGTLRASMLAGLFSVLYRESSAGNDGLSRANQRFEKNEFEIAVVERGAGEFTWGSQVSQVDEALLGAGD